ncbi:hypothetical protein HOU00_gp233 [Caulobacter phage CcrPW]|uniref:Uncharacterized protein n=1 Tax=Caulobacter phage CcrPW TaxID=2283271 RepID=A0A385EDG2_9CAUD|nr:hypothetical protein HOU00_gp233 [Caulobacter phage CcrPW]AXQ68892.1 hypothetical protein CcrPW_gp353 [Caulobacter phage CcrPW]
MNVANVLNKAADLIEERGWFQGNLRDDNDKRLCANMALAEAAEIRLQGDVSTRYTLYTQAQLVLLKHLSITILWDRVKGSLIIEWNDAPGRTLSEVATTMRDAAKGIA